MSTYRSGILRKPQMWFADNFVNWKEIVNGDPMEAVKLVNIPKWFEVQDAIWDFDTGDLKIKLDSFYLPKVNEGEILPDLDIVYLGQLATHVRVSKRIIVHVDTVEIPLSAP